MHKLAQVELQLDWSQLPYLEYSGPLLQKAAQPNAQYKKGPYKFEQINGSQTDPKCAFAYRLKSQVILLFNLLLLLFMGSTAFFGIMYGSHCTISANFYLYLQYFQQKVFSFSKINESQTDPKSFYLELILHLLRVSYMLLK